MPHGSPSLARTSCTVSERRTVPFSASPAVIAQAAMRTTPKSCFGFILSPSRSHWYPLNWGHVNSSSNSLLPLLQLRDPAVEAEQVQEEADPDDQRDAECVVN